MSRGASKRKLNPLSEESNCSEETPKSTRMPRNLVLIPAFKSGASSFGGNSRALDGIASPNLF